MRPIIEHFTDNDLYTFSCQYYILETYPRAEVEYRFFDRNGTVYPKGFAELRKWNDCVKLSCNLSKTLGNPAKCEYLIKQGNCNPGA